MFAEVSVGLWNRVIGEIEITAKRKAFLRTPAEPFENLRIDFDLACR